MEISFTVVILAMNYALACQAVNYAGKLGLNQGFAFIMFDLDLDLTGNTKKNLSATWSKDWDERAFQSTLLLSVNNNVSKEYLTFVEDVKRNRTGSLSQAHAVGTKMTHFLFYVFPSNFSVWISCQSLASRSCFSSFRYSLTYLRTF